MEGKLDRLVRFIYKKWRAQRVPESGAHPDEEDFACFMEGKLPLPENEKIKAHLLTCQVCAEEFAIQARFPSAQNLAVPEELITAAQALPKPKEQWSILEILLVLKEKGLELLNTTGDILVGQELVPAPLLRSRQIRDFKDEITILKDFPDMRVEIKIENKQGRAFSLIVTVKEKETGRVIKDVRVTLLKDEVELESYLSDSGRVIFEHVILGKYSVEISAASGKGVHITLDIKA